MVFVVQVGSGLVNVYKVVEYLIVLDFDIIVLNDM